jgi:FADH2 O2-dependent halogenase
MNDAQFDVAILGTGISGNLLGAILARNGVKVLMIERGSHPRFTIGESTTPETTALLGILAQRYAVPEVAHLSNFQSIRRHVTAACGIKRNFSFVYHRRGEEQRPQEVNQFPTWAPPFGPDVHFFRQDVDAHMLWVAVHYGATVRQRTALKALEIDGSGVDLETEGGETLRAKFVVDGTGYRSILADALGLREKPSSLMTRSRALFTHMIDVEPYDRCGPPRRQHGLPSPFHQGTLHHIFEGGWLWVIPFDNHPSSTSRLCSVGFCLDIDHFPPTDEPPEEEFRRLVARFPSVARQFEHARAARDWVSTPRIQYSSTEMVGDRFCLLPHSAGFVDALFSSGLTLALATINVLGDRLIEAVKRDDFSRQRFAYVETWFQRNLAYYDRLVDCSYASFVDFDLWNAWHRVWLLGSLYGVSGQHEIFARFHRTQDHRQLGLFEEAPYRGLQAIDLPRYKTLFDSAAALIDAVRAGELAPAEATSRIYALLEECELCPPPWKMTDSSHRFPGTFTLGPMLRLLAWGRFRSPEVVRRHYFRSGKSSGLLGALLKDQLSDVKRFGLGLGIVRDSLFSWNEDWKEVSCREPWP